MVRFEPFGDIDDFFRGLAAPTLAREYERTMEMRLDISEDDKGYVVNVDMPGVRKDDIDISVEGNQVSISAEVNRDKSRGQGQQLYNERYSGRAYRAFTLPREVDSEKASARYDGGVLTLTLPMKSGTASHRLEIG
jgi:HSP20 family protein